MPRLGADLWRGGLSRQLDWKGNNHTLLIARGTFGTLALFTFFVTLQHMHLATAVTIQYLSPIFTALIGVFVLREHVPARQWFFYGIAFAGVFVLKGFDSRVSALYLLIGIISAICSGMAYNLVRRLREREEPIVVVLHFQLVGVAAGLVFICFNWRTPLPWEWFCLLMCGVLTQIGQICLTKSLQAERIAKVAVLNYIGLIYALIFGVTIFGEHYTAQTVLGISLVVAGVLLAVLSENPSRPKSSRRPLNGDRVVTLEGSNDRSLDQARDSSVSAKIRMCVLLERFISTLRDS